MDTRDIVGGILGVKAVIDTVRSVGLLLRPRSTASDLLPVYRAVPKCRPPVAPVDARPPDQKTLR